MKETVNVLTGKVKASKDATIFRCLAIGSCIVIAGFDRSTKVSAMAHVMLPGVSPEKTRTLRTRYASDAIEEMLKMMLFLGANQGAIEVCLVGGSNVLKRKDDTICQANIHSVLSILNEKNIPIVAQSLGGTKRRSLVFDTETAEVYHSIGDEDSQLLWSFAVEGHREHIYNLSP